MAQAPFEHTIRISWMESDQTRCITDLPWRSVCGDVGHPWMLSVEIPSTDLQQGGACFDTDWYHSGHEGMSMSVPCMSQCVMSMTQAEMDSTGLKTRKCLSSHAHGRRDGRSHCESATT